MAFAAIASLLQTLDLGLKPYAAYLALEDNKQLSSLYKNLRYLQTFLEDFVRKHGDHRQMGILEKQIKDAVHQAEDTIETHLHNIQSVGKGRKKSRRKIYKFFQQCLSQVIKEIEKIKSEVQLKISEKGIDSNIIQSVQYLLRNSFSKAPGFENTIVGLDSDLVEMKDRLTSEFPSKLQIIPIVGMGGIGKSTLARLVYDDPLIVYHFHVRAWITISPKYEVKNILLGLVRSVAQLTDDVYEKNDESEQRYDILKDRIDQLTDHMLAEHLYKSLKGKRYLIVMDDIWLDSPWDDMRRSFPDDNNGSRVVLTSRHMDLARYVNSSSTAHEMRPLSVDQGWELLKFKVFSQQKCCPPELEEIGKQISEKCRGLPLAIVVVAGYLSKSSKERDIWLNVANNVGSLITRNQKQFLDIIAMSYNHLPHHLKACFLYMGAFPENIDIPVWKLTGLWVAEGFLKRDSEKGLEELAEECLEDLISRSLIMVEKRINHRVITCRIHDLLRDFCLREAKKEKFWHVMNRHDLFPEEIHSLSPKKKEEIHSHRRLCINSDIFPYVISEYSNPQVRTFLSNSNQLFFLSDSEFSQMGFKLLWVLDLFNYYFRQFPIQVLKLIHLRYLALSTGGELPTITTSSSSSRRKRIGKLFMFPSTSARTSDYSISDLANLQILIINWGKSENHILPRDIWKMTELRHIRLRGGVVRFDDIFPKETRSLVLLPNLQTLLTVSSANFQKEIVSIIPNLKKLGILVEGHSQTDFLNYFDSLHFLETLKLGFSSQDIIRSSSVSEWNAFPPNLRVLTLSGSRLPWEDMVIIGKIPKLEVLKLKENAFVGLVWDTIEGGFLQLKFLLLENNVVEIWKATEVDFPSLQHLKLRFCNALKEIPCEIGDISTLQIIELYSCGRSVVSSAKRIQEEQQSLGNNDLELRINLKSNAWSNI